MTGYFKGLFGTRDSAAPTAAEAPAPAVAAAAPAPAVAAGAGGVNDDLPPLRNDRVLKAAKGEKVDKVPVWIYGQAGEYLPETRDLVKKYTFEEICRNPTLCCETSMVPLAFFPLDAAIPFGDFLVVASAMGMKIKRVPGKGPVFEDPIKSVADLARLKEIDAAVDLKYVMNSVMAIRSFLQGQVPLFGFSAAPWTLMSYMIDGKDSSTWSQSKKWLYAEPKGSKELLDKLEVAIIDYMAEMAKNGAQALQFFDTSVGILTEAMFLEYVKPGYVRMSKAIRSRLGDKCPPLFLYPKGAHFYLPHLKDCGYDVICVDWCITPEKARELLGSNMTIQGNLDPCGLYSDDEQLRGLAVEMVKGFGENRCIANLGEDIYPDTDPAKVAVFVDAIHSY